MIEQRQKALVKVFLSERPQKTPLKDKTASLSHKKCAPLKRRIKTHLIVLRKPLKLSHGEKSGAFFTKMHRVRVFFNGPHSQYSAKAPFRQWLIVIRRKPPASIPENISLRMNPEKLRCDLLRPPLRSCSAGQGLKRGKDMASSLRIEIKLFACVFLIYPQLLAQQATSL